MNLAFSKYQATGNDFIMVDNRKENFPKNDKSLVARLCDRRFGIGADGLILMEESEMFDFTMVYFNADGGQGSFCGNGSRCSVIFAHSLDMIRDHGRFEAFDGEHEAIVGSGLIKVRMADVQNGSKVLNGTFIDTGSPHYVEIHQNVDDLDVERLGSSLRYSSEFSPAGANINFVEMLEAGNIRVRTYERGVEAETLSCGTGVTASALVTAAETTSEVQVLTLGGELKVSFERQENSYSNIWLEGPAQKSFDGEVDLDAVLGSI